jgi:hypothetical protein
MFPHFGHSMRSVGSVFISWSSLAITVTSSWRVCCMILPGWCSVFGCVLFNVVAFAACHDHDGFGAFLGFFGCNSGTAFWAKLHKIACFFSSYACLWTSYKASVKIKWVGLLGAGF